MMHRYLSIWFPYLLADKAVQLKPELKGLPFVLAAPARGRVIVHAASMEAVRRAIRPEMVVADARAILPGLQVFNYKEGVNKKILAELAEWALRFTPVAAMDTPDGLMLDISGCPHLWGGEEQYLSAILNRLREMGYAVRAAIADTIGAAWANARYGTSGEIVAPGSQLKTLYDLPPVSLRLNPQLLDRMHKLGFYKINSFIKMPASVLRRRFGQELLLRMGQTSGTVMELLTPIQPAILFQERLPCLEPIKTRTGIDIALKTLLENLSRQLLKENKGLRKAVFKGYRVDGNVQQVEVGTNRPVRNVAHLMRLFEQKIGTIKPALGIELFIIEAPVVEGLSVQQEALWSALGEGDANTELSDLLDRIAGKIGIHAIRRYLPAEHYWPERSVKLSHSISEKPGTAWRLDRPRPIYLLDKPEKIEVTVPIPDYPPMHFIYKGHIHKVKKADGPERIEREWWQDKDTQIRDYYRVEDHSGARYWLFRSGTYTEGDPQWFLHGYFA